MIELKLFIKIGINSSAEVTFLNKGVNWTSNPMPASMHYCKSTALADKANSTKIRIVYNLIFISKLIKFYVILI